MVGIEVATMVASMANRKITSMTPVTARLRFDPAPRQVGQHLEVEGRQRFAAWQPGLGEVTLDAPGLALGDFALGECGEELGGRPALPNLGPGGSPRSAKPCQCAWKLGRRSAVSIAGSLWTST